MVSLKAILIVVMIAMSVLTTQVVAEDVENVGDGCFGIQQVICGNDGIKYP